MSSPLNSNGPKLTIKMEDGKDKNSRDHMDIMRETEIKNDVSMHVPKAVEESNALRNRDIEYRIANHSKGSHQKRRCHWSFYAA